MVPSQGQTIPVTTSNIPWLCLSRFPHVKLAPSLLLVFLGCVPVAFLLSPFVPYVVMPVASRSVLLVFGFYKDLVSNR